MGELLGSTHTVYGAITGLDFDLVSDGAELSVGGLGFRGRGYSLAVAVDVVVADSRTTGIVWARSYRKQIWGREIEAGLFRFFDVNPGGNGGGPGGIGVEPFDIRIGRQENEPIHAALRWMMEQAAHDVVRDFTGAGDACDALVPAPSRKPPLAVAGLEPRVPRDGVFGDGAPAGAEDTDGTKTPEAAEAAPGATEPSGRPVIRLPDGRIVPAGNGNGPHSDGP